MFELRKEASLRPSQRCDSPAFALPQGGDVRDVVASVPGVKSEHLLEGQNATLLRMTQATLKISGFHRTKQRDPAKVQRIEQIERDFDRNSSAVSELRPCRFVVGLYRRLVFGERELESAVRIHVAVGDVMRNLLHGPPTGSIWSLQLVPRQSGNRVAEIARRFGDNCNQLRPLGLGNRCVKTDFADR